MSIQLKSKSLNLLLQARIENKIFFIRGKRVMLDRDLAELYEIETRALNQAVRRNKERFPDDFMFQLSRKEMENWKSQIVISNKERMGLRKPPFAFTELGVAMLSSALNSPKAIEVNIFIMRVFVRVREILLTHKDLREKIAQMEKVYDKKFGKVFFLINWLLEEKKSKKKIGFN